jgi:hypothetical protein
MTIRVCADTGSVSDWVLSARPCRFDALTSIVIDPSPLVDAALYVESFPRRMYSTFGALLPWWPCPAPFPASAALGTASASTTRTISFLLMSVPPFPRQLPSSSGRTVGRGCPGPRQRRVRRT